MSRTVVRLLCALGGGLSILACQSGPAQPSPAPAPSPAPPAQPAPEGQPLETTSGDPLPAEVVPFILPGYQALDISEGDLDMDGQKDAVLVLDKIEQPPNEDTDRPLLILVRKGGNLEQARRADHVVYCSSCGGVMGDPYQGVTVSAGRFEVSHYGGSAQRWANTYTFAYDAQRRDWLLDSEDHSFFSAFDPDDARKEHIPRSELGDISVSDFTSDSGLPRKWRVVAKKTFFYDQPDRTSQPRKAYLVEGDTIDGYRELTNFVRASFINSEGQSTEGFLLKKELSPVPR